MKIKTIQARQILDSRGNPTVEVDVWLKNGGFGRAAVPSGASTGEHEAIELRDNDESFHGKSVTKAISNIHTIIAPALFGVSADDQHHVDQIMIDTDGSDNKARLGANAILGVSLAVAKAAADAKHVELFEHIGAIMGNITFSLPRPMINIVNGGQHAPGATEIQEFMIFPKNQESFADSIRCGSEIFHELKKLFKDKGLSTTVGDEGGFVPGIKDNTEVLDAIVAAIESAGYQPGTDVELALDVAASEFYENGAYTLNHQKDPVDQGHMIEWLVKLADAYPITSIEDGLDQNDWLGWNALTHRIGDSVQIVGDDLLVTNTTFLTKAIETKACNAILIKPNQIGTLTETLEAVKIAKQHNFGTIISHRSGETEDTTIAHIAVGVNAGQIKTGSMSRGERTAKYNELLRIGEKLT
ncbi:TPA: phosphopyruvate hydratase [Candidatus Saccharibacteria bacterium]|nr:phosphopyruvate hydratase [Candidatus Saccharibacteria bacterium]HIO87917.1 phosphopyruvate hydratase [Candidatus Saccharibacteria bacterium]